MLLLAVPSWADDTQGSRVKLPDNQLTFKSDGVHKPLWYDDKVSTDQDLHPGTQSTDIVNKFSGRYALVGSHCMINRSYATVSVGSVSKHLDYLTDDTLTNSTTMYDVAGVGVGYKPVVSVRDLEHHFAKGTTAGFCLASTSTSILSLDVGQTYVINFYREGKWVGMQSAQAGKNIQGLNLKLISLPSADECVINIEASAPAEFDEIEFGYAGAAKVDVASMVKLKYAFVGDDHTYTLTTRSGGPNSEKDKKRKDIEDFFDYCTDNGIDIAKTSANVTHDFSLLGLKDQVTNSNLEDGFTIVLPLSVVWGGEMSVWSYAGAEQGELFKKGSVVGYNFGTAGLDIKLINAVRLELLDQNGNIIKGTGKTIGANLLTVGLGGGNNTVSMEAGQDFSGVKITFLSTGLGASGNKIYYAFVKEAPKLFPDAHHCPIEASADMNLCDYESSVRLFHNPDIPVTWTLEKWEYTPSQTDEVKPTIDQTTGYVSNIQYDGTYVFKATAADGCFETVTITKGDPKKDTGCENVLTNSDVDLANTKATDGSAADTQKGQTDGGGSLLSISGWSKDHPKDNILDGDPNTYAEYIEGLKLADNVRIITVQTKTDATGYQPSFQELMVNNATDQESAKKEDICVGFVMQMRSTGINLNLLQGFRIECYNKKGKTVYKHFVSQSNVLGLKLIGSNTEQKLEFAITVPADSTFYSYSLWTTGVLGLYISHLRIYYPFYERGSEVANCSNPIDCGAMQINNTTTGAKVSTGGLDSEKSGSLGTVNVATMMENLSFAVDNDPDYKTCTTFGGVADVATSYQIGIKMGRTLGYRHRLVIVMDAPNDILNVGVGKWMTIQTYYKGKPTTDKKTDWSVLGVDLLKTNDKAYYIMSPKTQYDEVLLTFNCGVNVADIHRLYGIAVQSDINGDGVPDCKDESSCVEPLVQDVSMQPACQGQGTTLTWRGLQNQNYVISLPDQENKLIKAENASTDQNATFSYTPTTVDEKPYWIYSLKIDKLDTYGNNLSVFIDNADTVQLASSTYTVHPAITHWRKDAPNTNWNEWGNWIEGSPFSCSDVVIPSDAKRYPVLTDQSSLSADVSAALTQADKDNWNRCYGIHFCPDAAVENVYKLSYQKAWVDLGLKNGIYRMFMAPLKSVYSGDFFVSSQPEENYFADLKDDNDPENRTKPFVYQRLWDKCLRGQQIPMTTDGGIGTGTDFGLLETDQATWSQAFNALSHEYSASSTVNSTKIAPDCFTLMVKDDNNISKPDDIYVIHLPKSGTRTYHYYDYAGTQVGGDQTITHTDNANKLWGDWGTDGDGITLNYILDSSTSYEKTGSQVFLVGNPLMSHLNLGPFINGNSNVNGVKVYDGNTIYSVIAVGNKLVATNDTKGSDDGTGPALFVGPSQAFFIETNETKTKAFQVNYTAGMYGSQPTGYDETYHSGNKAQSASAKALTPAEEEPAYLRVKATNGQYHVSTVLLQGIDQKAVTLIDEKYKPNLAAFSMEDNQAYDIRPVDADVIDLGFYTSSPCNVQLSFETSGNFDADSWRLYDRSTGNCYRLDETPEVSMEGANVGRFYLSRIGAVTKIRQARAADGVALNVAKGIATVTSVNDDLSVVAVYDESGSLVDRVQLNHERQAVLHVCNGVNIVKVCRAGKADKTYKVMGE